MMCTLDGGRQSGLRDNLFFQYVSLFQIIWSI